MKFTTGLTGIFKQAAESRRKEDRQFATTEKSQMFPHQRNASPTEKGIRKSQVRDVRLLGLVSRF